MPITVDSQEDYEKIEGKISNYGIITPNNIGIYMKDGTVYGNGENMDKAMAMIGGGSAEIVPDGTCYRYIEFNMPADTENIEKIILGGYEFKF